jgi:TolB-like protein
MKPETTITPEITFSKDLINAQLQKIFLDSFFTNSDILRKFLMFIVDQTLSGHANWLKEYTIGVNVLNKPSDFKPQENGIVRIHAGRLRRALHHYYNETGTSDLIHISVPKGRYVPVFSENGNEISIENLDDKIRPEELKKTTAPSTEKPAIAVMPFQHFHKDELTGFLTAGIGLQLSTALMEFEKYTVIAYHTMCNLCKKTTDLSRIASIVGAKYVITGNIQTQENRVRAHIQMVHAGTSKQLWSCMHEGRLTAENIFELQDEIVKLIIAEISKSTRLANEKDKRTSLIAVA